jgi:hypothetical protein
MWFEIPSHGSGGCFQVQPTEESHYLISCIAGGLDRTRQYWFIKPPREKIVQRYQFGRESVVSPMTNEEMQKTMEFILEHQAQFAVNIQRLQEERIRDQPRLARLEESPVTGATSQKA